VIQDKRIVTEDADDVPPTDVVTSQPASTEDYGSRLSVVTDILATFVAPATLIGALVFYFGYMRTRAWWLYFGIDPSVLGFSNQDYVLRSVNALFPALLALALAVAASRWAVLHADRLRARAARSPVGQSPRGIVKQFRIICMVAGGLAFAVGILALFWGVVYVPLATPLAIGAGTLLMALAKRLRIDRPRQSEGRGDLGRTAALWLLVTLGAFWAVSDFAELAGRGAAQRTSENLVLRPAVTIFSAEGLDLSGPGVESDELTSGGRYRFRYEGLRLLLRTGGQYVLVPEQWKPGGPVFVIPEGSSLRFEFR
jgi:hypothetical protein